MANWYYLHVDFDSPQNNKEISKLNKIMEGEDYDWIPEDVYSDGIRMLARSPLYTREKLIETLTSLEINGKGYFLERGVNCTCGDHCRLGCAYACLPTPSPEHWFNF